jgi:flagellar hook-associated protein 3 FlgL
LLAQLQRYANTDLNGQALFTGTSTHGRVTGLGITEPVTLTNGVNDQLVVKVDGVASGLIDLTSGVETLNGATLASRIQAGINADTALVNADKQVTVQFQNGRLTIISDSAGAHSTVSVSGGSGRITAGLAGGSATTGAVPFALTASVAPGAGNTGGVIAGAGVVADENLVTMDDYVIRFTSATAFDVLDVTVPVTTTRGAGNTGHAAVMDAGITDPSQLTLHAYQIQFTSSTQYSVVDTTTSTTVSSGNTYVSGTPITFEGLRVIVANGQHGGPQAGDTFSVSLSPRTVLSNQTYTSDSQLSFEGINLTLSTASGTPAAGDLFSVVTGMQYQGDDGVHAIEIGPGQTVPTNIPGSRLFSSAGTDLFATAKQLLTAFRTNDRESISQALGGFGRGLSAAGAVLGEIGAISNRLTANSAQLDEAKGFFTQMLSQTEDVDLAKAISDLTLQQYAIEAASRTLTRVFENSLMNYLR